MGQWGIFLGTATVRGDILQHADEEVSGILPQLFVPQLNIYL
jgi:hypothetical protein